MRSGISASAPTARSGSTNDYYVLPVTEKQLAYALQISKRAGVSLPSEAQADRKVLSDWIERNRAVKEHDKYASYPSSKQVAFAERIASRKRREIPREWFHDRTLMSRWIDGNR